MIKHLKNIIWNEKKTSCLNRRPTSLNVAINDETPNNKIHSEIANVIKKNYGETPKKYVINEENT